MTIYYFLGYQSSIGSYGILTQFGQSITLPEDVYAAVKSKVPLITKQQFDSIKFTPAELRQWAQPVSHDNAPKDFLAKKAAALKLWRDGDAPVVAAYKPPVVPDEPSHVVAEASPSQPENN